MKTLDEYMNDPRIDVCELEPVRRVHAIRLQLNDERQQMGSSEYDELMNVQCRDYLDKHGVSLSYVDLAGQGRIRNLKKSAMDQICVLSG
jgi:hypothetical protein